jgi:hypothetical protein
MPLFPSVYPGRDLYPSLRNNRAPEFLWTSSQSMLLPPIAVILRLLDEHGEAIVRKALVVALQGAPPLLRTLLAYLLRRPEDRPVETGPLQVGSAEELSKTLEKVLRKVASGKLSLGQAQAVAALLEGRRRVLETQDLEMRLQALEQLPKRGSST